MILDIGFKKSVSLWDVHLAIRAFDWEDYIWEEFNTTINSIFLDVEGEYIIIWILESSMTFMCKLFRNELIRESSVVLLWKSLWRVQASMKAKSFLWLLLWRRLHLRNRLARLNLINEKENKCPLCGEFNKDRSHLIFHCIKLSYL